MKKYMIFAKPHALTLSVVVILLNVGCTTVYLRGPVAEVLPPRPIKKQDWSWDLIKYKSEYQFKVTDDASDRPVTLNSANDSTIEQKGFFQTGASYGILDNLAIGLDLAGGLAPRIQYTREVGGAEGTSPQYLSAFASLQADSATTGGDQKGKYGPGGYPWRASSKTTENQIGISYGMTATESSMMYVGLAHSQFSSQALIDQSAAPENSSPSANYDLKASGHSDTIGLGIVVGTREHLDLNLAYSTFKMDDYTKSNFQYGIRYSTPMDFMRSNENFEDVQKETWRGSDFGALGLSYIVGCGTGQAIQDNWDRKGKYFCSADALSLALALQSISSSTGIAGGSSSSGASGLALYLVSRIWQIIDVIQEASSSTRKVPKTKN